MVFSSSLFLFAFFPFFFLIYFLIDRAYKNYWILLCSFLFYQWGAPTFVYTVLAVTFVDFYIVRAMHRSEGKKRLWLLVLSLLLNIGLLCYFKYANFFVDNLNHALASIGIAKLPWLHIALPIGISFFAFETLTYAIDVYRRVHAPLDRLLDYYTYILLFPKLIAGPIVRFHEIADQLTDRSREDTIDNKLLGFFRFIIGLSKKVLVANTMAHVADQAFNSNIQGLSSAAAWTGIIAYSFQIYFDFSGYSDMAIGMGRMMGFRFIENFNNPYISQSITEFWRRWHMSLGRWMRDYLYIPLGGNQGSTGRMYFNLALVFLVSGLWHGASWNFVIWGAFHGAFLIADRLFLLRIYERIGKWPAILLTYFITLIGWVFFRAETLPEAGTYLSRMFAFGAAGESIAWNAEFSFFMMIAVLASTWASLPGMEALQMRFFDQAKSSQTTLAWSFGIVLLLILSSSYLLSAGFNPFIYFRF